MSSSGIRRTPTLRDFMESCDFIIGIDEVGLGAWAGPMCLGGVLAGKGFRLEGLRDSKAMTERQRERIIDHIYVGTIDTVGVLKTSQQIVERGHSESWVEAVVEVVDNLIVSVPSQCTVGVIVDGAERMDARTALEECYAGLRVEFAVGGDDIYPQVSAASVMAKVYRDTLMKMLHVKQPQYDWECNKGYGTARHRKGLEKFGATKYHRQHARKHWPIRTISS